MAETQTAVNSSEPKRHRNLKIGEVVSTKMQKTIVVEVEMRKAHPKYRRVIGKSRRFYAHDEQNEAHLGDVVSIEETRPLSKLKRWRLKEIVRRAMLVSTDVSAQEGQVGQS